jgi:hypothetical protein
MFRKHKTITADNLLYCPLCDGFIDDGQTRVAALKASYYWHQLELMKRERR